MLKRTESEEQYITMSTRIFPFITEKEAIKFFRKLADVNLLRIEIREELEHIGQLITIIYRNR